MIHLDPSQVLMLCCGCAQRSCSCSHTSGAEPAGACTAAKLGAGGQTVVPLVQDGMVHHREQAGSCHGPRAAAVAWHQYMQHCLVHTH